MPMKLCPKCKTMKHRNAFWKATGNKDGLQSLCIRCLRTHLAESRYKAAYKHDQKPERKERRKLRKRWQVLREKHSDLPLTVLVRKFKRKWGTLPPKGRKGKYLGV